MITNGKNCGNEKKSISIFKNTKKPSDKGFHISTTYIPIIIEGSRSYNIHHHMLDVVAITFDAIDI